MVRWSMVIRVLITAILIAFLLPALSQAVEEEGSVPGLDERWTGDFDGMTERRLFRVLVVHNKMMFFLDKGRKRGKSYDFFMEFEKFVDAKLKAGTHKTKVVFIPVTRNRRLPALA